MHCLAYANCEGSLFIFTNSKCTPLHFHEKLGCVSSLKIGSIHNNDDVKIFTKKLFAELVGGC
jgi:hypothetical protein